MVLASEPFCSAASQASEETNVNTMGDEVIGLPDFFIRRARALADAGEGNADGPLLAALRDQALDMGLLVDARALEEALAKGQV